jgi:transposase
VAILHPRASRGPSFLAAPLAPDSPEALALGALIGPAHPARIILAALEGLDLTPLLSAYAGRGSPPYPPLPLLAVALLEAREGHLSPAAWLRHAEESIPIRWLLRGLAPSRSAWYAFRGRLPAPLLGLAHQAVRQAVAEGLTPAAAAAIDGTALAASSTRHHLLNEETLARRVARLDAAIAADTPAPDMPAPDTPAPDTPAPGWLGKTPGGRRRQRRHYAKIQKGLRRRQAINRLRPSSKRKPDSKVLISPGDPEAPLGLDKEKVYRPLYNVQLVADVGSPLVLTYLVADRPNDAGLLGTLLRQTREAAGHGLKEVLADSGYAGGADLAAAEAEGVTLYAPWQSNDYSEAKPGRKFGKEDFIWKAAEDAYECPEGKTLARNGTQKSARADGQRVELRMYRAKEADCAACPRRGECLAGKGPRAVSRTEYEEAVERLRERMGVEEGKTRYKKRKETVERLNADLKHHRKARRLTGRGLRRAEAEVGLLVLGHDLTALARLRRQAKEGAPPAIP